MAGLLDDFLFGGSGLLGRGSWYSQYPGWVDYADRPNSNALGVPDEEQGIALPRRDTLGMWFNVRAPNGQMRRLQQTDIGPSNWTGRGIDISAAAADSMGYTPKTFPTDAAFGYEPAIQGSPTGLPVQAGEMPNLPVREDNRMPAAAQLAQGTLPQQSGGFLGGLADRFNNPLVMLGLGLASGKTPQEGFGNAMNALLAQRRIEQSNLTGNIREYQYAKSQGYQGSFAEWQKDQANIQSRLGLTPQWYQYKDPQTGEMKWGMAQLGERGEVNPLTAPGGGAWAPPTTQINTPQGVTVVPRYQAPGGASPGGEGVSSGGGTYYPKEYVGPEESKKVGEGQGTDFNSIQKDARSALGMKSTLSRMGQLNDQAYQGAGAPGLQYARSLLTTFGVPPGDVPAGEELNMLSARLTLEATGGSLGNQISNSDRDFIVSQNPNLSNTREGRRQLIDTAGKLADRRIAVGRLASEYRQRNGNMTGFNQYLADWAEKNPLFPQRAKQSGASEPTSKESPIRRYNPTTGRIE